MGSGITISVVRDSEIQNMDDPLNDTLDDVEGYCDKCGYISQDVIESGLHALECEGLNEDERRKDYVCEKCRDSTSPIWGIETTEFCSLVAKTAYEKVVHFRPNTHTVPANNVGREFYDLYDETLVSDGTKNHFGWYANHIFIHIYEQRLR